MEMYKENDLKYKKNMVFYICGTKLLHLWYKIVTFVVTFLLCSWSFLHLLIFT